MFAGPFLFQVIHNLQIDESMAFTFIKKKVKNKVPNIDDDDVEHSTFILQNEEHSISKTEVSFTFNYSQNNRENAVCQICCALTWYLPKI
jgi:hypothetical protein